MILDTGDIHFRTKSIKQKKRQEPSGWGGVGYLGEIGFTVSLPIVGGALFGSYLDRVWSTYPRATLAFIFIGIIVSLVNFVRVIKEIISTKR